MSDNDFKIIWNGEPIGSDNITSKPVGINVYTGKIVFQEPESIEVNIEVTYDEFIAIMELLKDLRS